MADDLWVLVVEILTLFFGYLAVLKKTNFGLLLALVPRLGGVGRDVLATEIVDQEKYQLC